MPPEDAAPPADPLWYKDAVIYELHVRAFHDADGDGIGDFRGLTEKLDYLRDLGVTAIWILPFYPSPLRDDGYDIADYEKVHASYGTIRDFKRFLREAHRRDLRVITELVINHTSDQHPWFQRARHAPPGSAWRDFYVWSDTPDLYRDARIIFKDFEPSNWSWDPVAESYYWHRFYSHQPDLNFENPRVMEAVKSALDFWMDMGVDGMRLDAIPYLFEREGTNCENLPETHAALKELRAHLDAHHEGRMFLAEANQWPEDAAAYFGDGDECHMNFHFPLMPRLFMSVRMEDRFPIIDILEQTPEIPDNCQWAIFLRNHDELTLEMVTDEERDYMYTSFARDERARINLGIRRRLAPLLDNDRRKIELLNGLLFSLPGTPVLYYGDEIGMGDNFYLGDRNGVRTPMQWNSDRNAGFSRTNPQRLYLPIIIDPEYHFESVNVEAQQQNPSSLLWWMKRIIALRKQYAAFSRGEIRFLFPENRRVLAFVRERAEERILIVANLSRFAQAVELDLGEFEGLHPVELFGHTEFPRIGELPYFLTLGPHAFYWFSLEPSGIRTEQRGRGAAPEEEEGLPVVKVGASWEEAFEGEPARGLRRALHAYLPQRRWFQGKARRIRRLLLLGRIPAGEDAAVLVVRVDYAGEGGAERYLLPLAAAGGDRARVLLRHQREAVLARLEVAGEEAAVLHDAMADGETASRFLEAIRGRRRLKGEGFELVGAPLSGLARRLEGADLRPHLSRAEQSNTSVIFGDAAVLKLYRRPDPGTSLDLEMGRALADAGFEQTPPVLGSLELVADGEDGATAALLQAYVPNEGDAWNLALDQVAGFLERELARPGDSPARPAADPAALLERASRPPDEEAATRIGPALEHAWLIGRRTAEMHLALASLEDRPDFAPEEFSTLYQRSLYQSMRNLVGRTYQLLQTRADAVPPDLAEPTRALLGRRDDVLERLRAVVGGKMAGVRIRVHGDFHLGQVLFTGRDFVITDFEGEPIRPIGERRLKRSPLRDVAGMLRSFHYAVHATLLREGGGGRLRDEDVDRAAPWAAFWYAHVGAAFLRGYLELVEGEGLIPEEAEQRAALLGAFLLEKAVYELGYELGNRPDWVAIPLEAISELLGA